MRTLTIKEECITKEFLHYTDKSIVVEIENCKLKDVFLDVDNIKSLRLKNCDIVNCSIKTTRAKVSIYECNIERSIIKDESDKRSIEADCCIFKQCVIDSKVYLYNVRV